MMIRAVKPLRQVAVASAFFSLKNMNAEQEYAKKAGMHTKNLFMLNT